MVRIILFSTNLLDELDFLRIEGSAVFAEDIVEPHLRLRSAFGRSPREIGLGPLCYEQGWIHFSLGLVAGKMPEEESARNWPQAASMD